MLHVKFGDAPSARVIFLALLVFLVSVGIRPEPATTHQSPVVVGKVVRASHGVKKRVLMLTDQRPVTEEGDRDA